MTTIPPLSPTRSWRAGVVTSAVLLVLALTPKMAAQTQTTYQYASGTTQVAPPPVSKQLLSAAPPLTGVNITVDSPTAGNQNETSIAVNTNNPSNLIGGSNDYRTGDSRCGRYQSTNNGQTWTDLTPFPMFTDPSFNNGVFTNIAFTTAGDPGVAFDADGHAYYLSCTSPERRAFPMAERLGDRPSELQPPLPARTSMTRAISRWITRVPPSTGAISMSLGHV